MHLDPLLSATPPVPLHAIAAIAAFVLGLVQLVARKGGRAHVMRGRVWVALMLAVAASSLWITEIGGLGLFSWLHILSIWVPIALMLGVREARRGLIRAHGWTMVSLFVGALVVAGAFTFMPYRVMNDVVTGRALAD